MTAAFSHLIQLDLSSLATSLTQFDTKINELTEKVSWLEYKRDEDQELLAKYKKTIQSDFGENLNKIVTSDEKAQQQSKGLGLVESLCEGMQIQIDQLKDNGGKQGKTEQDIQFTLMGLKRQLQMFEKTTSETMTQFTKETLLNVRSLEANFHEKFTDILLEIKKIDQLKDDLENQDLAVVDLSERMEKVEVDTQEFQENLQAGNIKIAGAEPTQVDSPKSSVHGRKNSIHDSDLGATFSDPLKLGKKDLSIQIEEKQRDLKNWVKQVIQEQSPATKDDLLTKVLSKIQFRKRMVEHLLSKSQNKASVEVEVDLLSADDNKPRDDQALVTQKSPKESLSDLEQLKQEQEVEVETPFQFEHLASDIHEIIESNVRFIADTAVYLERVRPRFKFYEIGNEMNHLFSHVEVQTYQQDLLLKMADDRASKIEEICLTLDELQQTTAHNTRRLVSLDQGRQLDIDTLKEVGRDSEALVQILTDVKTDVLDACGSKAEVSDLAQRIKQLELEALESKGVPEEFELAIQKMQTIPSMMNSLQLQVMRVETNLFDQQRQTFHIESRMQQFGQLESEIQASQIAINKRKAEDPFGAEQERQGAQQIMLAQFNFVSKQELSTLEQDFQNQQTLVFQLQAELKRIVLKQIEISKTTRQLDKRANGTQKKVEDHKTLLAKLAGQVKSKTEIEDFDDEIRHLTACIGSLDSKSFAKGTASKVMQKKAPSVGGGGMSKKERDQLENAQQTMEKLDQSTRILQTQMRQIGIEDIKLQLKQIPDKATRQQIEELQLEFFKEIGNVRTSNMETKSDLINRFQRQDTRITRVLESNVEKSDEAKDFKSQINRLEDQMMALKRKANATSLKSKLMAQAADANPSQEPMQPMIDEESTSMLDQKFTQLLDAVRKKIDVIGDNQKKVLSQIGTEDKDKKRKQDFKDMKHTLRTLKEDYKQDVPHLQHKLDDLAKKFDEKIRRQALVQQQKHRPMNEDDQLMYDMKHKPKFVAQHVTRELVLNGRLPQIDHYGDHLARYGKGFSQMLSMAGEQKNSTVDYSQTMVSPKLMHGVSLGQLSISDADLLQREREYAASVLARETAATAEQLRAPSRNHHRQTVHQSLDTREYQTLAHSPKSQRKRNHMNRSTIIQSSGKKLRATMPSGLEEQLSVERLVPLVGHSPQLTVDSSAQFIGLPRIQ